MSKPSDHAARAREFQAQATSLMGLVDWDKVDPTEAVVNCLSAIESRLAALTEAVLSTVPYPVLANAEEKAQETHLRSPGIDTP